MFPLSPDEIDRLNQEIENLTSMDPQSHDEPLSADEGSSGSCLDDEELNGLIIWAKQSALVFGSDRKKKTKYRPVLVLNYLNGMAYVLPCTTKRKKKRFFCLNKENTIWFYKKNGDAWASCFYEFIPINVLKKTIGRLNRAGREACSRWLKECL